MTGAIVIRLLAKSGVAMPWSEEIEPGSFLQRWDLNYRGVGAAWWTSNPALAFKFPNAASALAAYSGQSRVAPFRPDGEPNRPLTAYTVEIVEFATLARNS